MNRFIVIYKDYMQNNTLSFLQSQDSYGNMSKLVKRIEEGDTYTLRSI
jgi:hypothetical protein